jgi:hypothetical protein
LSKVWDQVGHSQFFMVILCYSQIGDDPKEDVGKFGYKQNMKVKLGYLLEPCIEIC